MRTHLFWHGSKTLSLTLDPAKTLDGGLHLGSLEQASMRNHQVLYEVATKDLKTRRCKDEGGNWKNRIREAKSRGFEAIFYLNRYEGVSAARIEALSASGDLDKLDRLTDAQFRKLVPEAQDSLILLSGTSFEIISITLKKG